MRMLDLFSGLDDASRAMRERGMGRNHCRHYRMNSAKPSGCLVNDLWVNNHSPPFI